MSSGIRRPNKKPGSSAGMRVASAVADTRASTDYTLMAATRKRTHNVMRFLGERTVDLESFTAPVKMRRRNREYYRLKNKKRNEERMAQLALEQDPLQLQAQQQTPGAEANGMPPKEERPKADINLIADAGGARRNKRNLFKKRTKQVFFANEDKRRLDIEEARPWVLEDDDEKEVWTGTLEGGQSSSYVLFVLAENGFKVVPVDRWYKFAPKLNYKTLTLDEAEEELQRQRKGHATHDRWIMHRRNPKGEEGDAAGGPSNGESSRRGALVKYEVDDILSDDGDDDDDDGNGGGGPAKKRKRGGKNGGADEVAFEMQFDDDEEMGDVRFEFNEEENNERSEQHNKGHVSIFGTDDEDDSDGDNDRPAGKGTDEQGKRLKKMRKLIRKREGNVDYESDREVNPYLSESEFDSDDSDEEEPAANQDEQQKQQDGEKPAEGDKPAEDAAARPVGSRQTSPRPDSQPSTAGNGASGVKKRKRVPAAPPASSPAGAPSGGPGSAHKHHRASSPSAASTSTLITKQEIVDLIRNGVNTTKDLIGHVRKKLKANPDNKSRIYAILKEVATFKNNHLSLKKP